MRIAILALGALVATASPRARAARPVARWDVVPDQQFAGIFEAGVCAFHLQGVKVEFRVGEQLLHTAQAPTRNPRTNVWEFWVPLAAANFPDGPVVVTARALSLAEPPEVYDLPALTLHANGGGTLTVAVTNWVDAAAGIDTNSGTEAAPLRTLAAAVKKTPSGGTVNLKPGSYSSVALGGGSSRPYWTTIQAAPGVPRDAVEIGPGRPGTQRVRWRNLTLYCDSSSGKYTTILTGENGSHSVWVDGCKAHNKQGRWGASSTTFGNKYVAYVTGGITTEMGDGPGGSIVRGHVIDTITSDAFTGSGRLVVNSLARNINPGSTGAHPDFQQSYAVAPNWCENVILYNVRGYDCVSQGLFGVRLRNSAFVNVEFEKGNTVMYSQYSDVMDNVLFLHPTIVKQSWLWRDTYAPTDVQVVNGLFQSMSGYPGDGSAGLTVHDNHFVDATRTLGTNASSGDPRFADANADDYRLSPDSPARKRGIPLQCVPADIDGHPHPETERNLGAHADPSPKVTLLKVSAVDESVSALALNAGDPAPGSQPNR